MNQWLKYWERLADSRDDLLSGDWTYVSRDKYSKRINYIANLLKLTAHDTLVDIGCGKALFLNFSLTTVNFYIGLDFAMKQLIVNKNETHSARPNRLFINGKADCLPFKSSSIKKLLINSVTHYLDETGLKIMLCEIDRVLHSSGMCLLGDTQSESPIKGNSKENIPRNFNTYLRYYLKKIPMLVWLNSTINKTTTDIKRGFRIHRNTTNKYEINQLVKWIKEVNTELDIQVLHQNEYALYPDRYDILIKKTV